jgi:hypothetical protein
MGSSAFAPRTPRNATHPSPKGMGSCGSSPRVADATPPSHPERSTPKPTRPASAAGSTDDRQRFATPHDRGTTTERTADCASRRRHDRTPDRHTEALAVTATNQPQSPRDERRQTSYAGTFAPQSARGPHRHPALGTARGWHSPRAAHRLASSAAPTDRLTPLVATFRSTSKTPAVAALPAMGARS